MQRWRKPSDLEAYLNSRGDLSAGMRQRLLDENSLLDPSGANLGFWKMYAVDAVLSVVDGDPQTEWWALLAIDMLINLLDLGHFAVFASLVAGLIAVRAARRRLSAEDLAAMFG